MAKYKIITGVMKGLTFNGHPVNIGGESRIWNDDSTGQAFPSENCVRIWYKKVNHIVEGEFKFTEYYKAFGCMQWIKIPKEEGESSEITHFIELRYNESNLVQNGYIVR